MEPTLFEVSEVVSSEPVYEEEGIKKRCSRCEEWKELREFCRDVTHSDGCSSRCRMCTNINAKEYRNRPGQAVKRRDQMLMKNYGIGLDDFLNMIKEQDGLCAACGLPLDGTSGKKSSLSPHVDHDHKTGKIRNILHARCNLIIGNADDVPDLLRKCAEYLERHGHQENKVVMSQNHYLHCVITKSDNGRFSEEDRSLLGSSMRLSSLSPFPQKIVTSAGGTGTYFICAEMASYREWIVLQKKFAPKYIIDPVRIIEAQNNDNQDQR